MRLRGPWQHGSRVISLATWSRSGVPPTYYTAPQTSWYACPGPTPYWIWEGTRTDLGSLLSPDLQRLWRPRMGELSLRTAIAAHPIRGSRLSPIGKESPVIRDRSSSLVHPPPMTTQRRQATEILINATSQAPWCPLHCPGAEDIGCLVRAKHSQTPVARLSASRQE